MSRKNYPKKLKLTKHQTAKRYERIINRLGHSNQTQDKDKMIQVFFIPTFTKRPADYLPWG